jgi:hypothetical protein
MLHEARMKRIRVVFLLSSLAGLFSACGAGVGGVGAQCARGNSNNPQTLVTCEAALTCCGLPDTGGTCQAPDGGALCPSGTIAL